MGKLNYGKVVLLLLLFFYAAEGKTSTFYRIQHLNIMNE